MTPPADALERQAAALLAEALAQTGTLHLPGARDAHRARLARAIELAHGVLDAAENAPEAMAGACSTLVKAHAARAADARHGAGQLSLSAQRAPTRDACDDGWQRVQEIVAVAEASAFEAERLARMVDDRAAWQAARGARAAAQDARRLLDERNHAYTFHADPGFSFGEGWYLAAASVLDGVAIQIEPDKAQTFQAERFLRDAGLGSKLQPYRPRPRANKQLPEIVARAFRADPLSAQRKLRSVFLGDGPIAEEVCRFADRTLRGAASGKKVLLWLRYCTHHPARNTTYAELALLCGRVLAEGLVPVLLGDGLRDGEVPAGALDMTLFWKEPVFQDARMRRAQLELFEHLKTSHGLVGQLGVTTAGMDGPALLGLPTVYLTDAPNVRLGTWVGAIPGYQEVVRVSGYLEQVSRTVRQWAG